MSSDRPHRKRWGHDQPASKPPWEVDPVALLREYETKRTSRECMELVHALVTEKDCRRAPGLSWQLWQMVIEHDSIYAAYAVRGTTWHRTQGDIYNAVSKCVKSVGLLKRNDRFSRQERRRHWYSRATYLGGGREPLYVSPVAPVALAPWEPEERDLLLRAVQYVPKDVPYDTGEDATFRMWAAANLATTERSRDALVGVLLRRREPAIVNAILSGLPMLVFARDFEDYRLEFGVSRSKKIYRIARQRLGYGRLRSFRLAYPPRRRHREFFETLDSRLTRWRSGFR